MKKSFGLPRSEGQWPADGLNKHISSLTQIELQTTENNIGSFKIDECHQSINMGWDLESVGSWPIHNSVGCCHQQF